MGYLLTEIVVYLLIAGLIGFAFGWAVKAGALDKYCDKLIGFIKGFFGKKNSSTEKETSLLSKAKDAWNAYYLTLTTTKKVVKEEVTETIEDVKKPEETTVVEEVALAKVPEAIKEESKVEKVQLEASVSEEIKEVVEETAPEVIKEVEAEIATVEKTVEVKEDENKPTLLIEPPAEGQDKLSALKGIGPVLEKKLNELGVYTYAQIASWTTEQEIWIGAQMAFPKKVSKEEWVKQAKELLKNK